MLFETHSKMLFYTLYNPAFEGYFPICKYLFVKEINRFYNGKNEDS